MMIYIYYSFVILVRAYVFFYGSKVWVVSSFTYALKSLEIIKTGEIFQ